MSLYEVALVWVTSQSFPASALCGAETVTQIENVLPAGDLTRTKDERARLDLTRDDRPE